MTLHPPLTEQAPAKINLTLHIHGRRADGYHDLESLVAFADLSDTLTLEPSQHLGLEVSGPTSQWVGPPTDNLILKAALGLKALSPDLRLGRFTLSKHLPVAAGIGGGSADAAAALRLLARLNGLPLHDLRLMNAARAIGADVPVCLDSQPRMMRGAGERLGQVEALPPLNAVLVNPGVPIETAAVFTELRLSKGQTVECDPHFALGARLDSETLIALLANARNDLQPAAMRVAPVVGAVVEALAAQPGCRLARMSGSGATCFGLFSTMGQVFEAVRTLRKGHSGWWVQPASLGGLPG